MATKGAPDFSQELAPSRDPVMADIGLIKQAGALEGAAIQTEGNALASSIATIGSKILEGYVGYQKGAQSAEIEKVLANVDDPNYQGANIQALNKEHMEREEARQGAVGLAGTVFGTEAETQGKIDARVAALNADLQRIDAAKNQQRISGAEARAQITAIVKRHVAENPGIAHELRKSAAEMFQGGVGSIDTFGEHQALFTTPKLTGAQKAAQQFQDAITERAVKAGLDPTVPANRASAQSMMQTEAALANLKTQQETYQLSATDTAINLRGQVNGLQSIAALSITSKLQSLSKDAFDPNTGKLTDAAVREMELQIAELDSKVQSTFAAAWNKSPHMNREVTNDIQKSYDNNVRVWKDALKNTKDFSGFKTTLENMYGLTKVPEYQAALMNTAINVLSKSPTLWESYKTAVQGASSAGFDFTERRPLTEVEYKALQKNGVDKYTADYVRAILHGTSNATTAIETAGRIFRNVPSSADPYGTAANMAKYNRPEAAAAIGMATTTLNGIVTGTTDASNKTTQAAVWDALVNLAAYYDPTDEKSNAAMVGYLGNVKVQQVFHSMPEPMRNEMNIHMTKAISRMISTKAQSLREEMARVIKDTRAEVGVTTDGKLAYKGPAGTAPAVVQRLIQEINRDVAIKETWIPGDNSYVNNLANTINSTNPSYTHLPVGKGDLSSRKENPPNETNPLNLTIPGKQGQFQRFESVEKGILAASKQLDRYAQGKVAGFTTLDTVEKIAKVWNNEKESGSMAAKDYIKIVVENSGLNPTQKLNMSDPKIKGALIYGMSIAEGRKLDPAKIMSVLSPARSTSPYSDVSVKGIAKVGAEVLGMTDEVLSDMEIKVKAIDSVLFDRWRELVSDGLMSEEEYRRRIKEKSASSTKMSSTTSKVPKEFR